MSRVYATATYLGSDGFSFSLIRHYLWTTALHNPWDVGLALQLAKLGGYRGRVWIVSDHNGLNSSPAQVQA